MAASRRHRRARPRTSRGSCRCRALNNQAAKPRIVQSLMSCPTLSTEKPKAWGAEPLPLKIEEPECAERQGGQERAGFFLGAAFFAAFFAGDLAGDFFAADFAGAFFAVRADAGRPDLAADPTADCDPAALFRAVRVFSARAALSSSSNSAGLS